MTAPTVYPNAAALGLYRAADDLGAWPYRGQVAAVGIGHSPTLRRWDGDPQTSIGAWTILAIRRAIEDAGVAPSQVEGLVMDASHHQRGVLAARQAGPGRLPGRVHQHQ